MTFSSCLGQNVQAAFLYLSDAVSCYSISSTKKVTFQLDLSLDLSTSTRGATVVHSSLYTMTSKAKLLVTENRASFLNFTIKSQKVA